MRSKCLLAICFAACTAALAQNGAPSEEKPASLEGVVTQTLSGAPLPRAQVHLIGTGAAPQEFGASTGPDGKFSIASIPKGPYTVTVKRTGYVMPPARDGRRAIELVLQPGEKKEGFTMKLTPTGAISGRVTGVEGVPIEGASVMADDGSGEGPEAATDENGNFRIGGLAPGKYRVRASTDWPPFQTETRTDGTEQVHYSPTYFPNALDRSGATRVQVAPDSEAGGTAIQLVRTPVVRVSGAVLGAPRNASVSVMLSHDGRMNGVGAKPDGTFQVWNLGPGKYRLEGEVYMPDRHFATTVAEFDLAGSNVDKIELRVLPPIELSGKVNFDDDRARPPSQPAPALRLFEISGRKPATAAVQDDGSFRITGVAAGLYRVTPSWPGVFVRSMRWGSDAIDGNLLDLFNGAGASLSVLVSSAVGEVSGLVSDVNGPIAGGRVVLSLQVRDAERPALTFTIADANGNYRFGNLAPGKYRLAAVDDGDPAILKGVLDDYEDVLAAIELQPGDKITQNLTRHTGAK